MAGVVDVGLKPVQPLYQLLLQGGGVAQQGLVPFHDGQVNKQIFANVAVSGTARHDGEFAANPARRNAMQAQCVFQHDTNQFALDVGVLLGQVLLVRRLAGDGGVGIGVFAPAEAKKFEHAGGRCWCWILRRFRAV